MKALLPYSTAKLQAGITGIDMKIYTAEKNPRLTKMKPGFGYNESWPFLRVILMPQVHLLPEGPAHQSKS